MNMGTNSHVAAFNSGLKGSLMLYVLGSILFTVATILASAVIISQAMRYKSLATLALRSLSMDGLPTKKAQAKANEMSLVVKHFSLQQTPLPWKPQASV